jgi:hypothetical protein
LLAVIVWLLGMLIFFFILYNIIQHALNTSDLAKTAKEIKELLGRNGGEAPDEATPPRSRTILLEKVPLEEPCPACGTRVRTDAAECPDCGIKLSAE